MTGQFTNWITGRRPSAWDADRNGKVFVKSGDSIGQLEHWGVVTALQEWCHTSYWQQGFRLQAQKLSGWINDRLPEIHDSDVDGDVLLPDPDGAGEVCVPWQSVVAGQTWRHCFGANQHQQTVEPRGRTFASVVPYPNPGNHALLAVANDGTAWELSRFGAVWQQLPVLPQYDVVSDWKNTEAFTPSTEKIQEIANESPVVNVPVPLCVRLPEGDDLDKDGNCLYGFWDSSQGGGRWSFCYQNHACEEGTHWIRYDAEALPETCYKPANVD